MRNAFLGLAFAVPLLTASAQEEPKAEQVYKNIQVLKGVPASTFMNTMFFQRYALGVSCSYCHVDGSWEKDDKPAKAAARKMIAMVREINDNHFDAKSAVNCMTCHHGAPKPHNDIPTPRISLEDMLGPRPRAAAPGPMPAVDAVLGKYMAAMGGADALAKIRNRVVKGNLITAEGSIVPFEDTYATAPARWLSVRHFGGTLGDFATGFDGAAGWNSDNRGITDQHGDALAQLRMTAEFQNRSDFASLYSQWAVTGTDNTGSAETVILSAVSTITGRTERLYFDVASGLLVRRSVLTESLFGPFTTDTYFENYRTIDGVTLPIMISEFTPDFGTIRKVNSVEDNATLGDASFARPATPRSPGGSSGRVR